MKKTIYTPQQMTLVSRLKKARLRAHLTQVEVAKKIRRPQSWIARLESGQRRIDVLELQMLAKLYQRPIKEFLP